MKGLVSGEVKLVGLLKIVVLEGVKLAWSSCLEDKVLFEDF